ncbi:SRPBCC family protein [Brevibacterium album]|uniref:SRPBCC family protein n=1 Tax=Brevibacterium album TaxID=417948 RepID=UPI0003F8DE8B|nr:SRPBCC domain-containing protein [Brevibacterium album]
MSTHTGASAPSTAPEFTIARTFDAPRDLVWRAWTEVEHLAGWLHPFGVTTDSISFDVREGGLYRYTMTNEETGEQYPTGGVFLEVAPQERLVFTWGSPDDSAEEAASVITLTFTEDGERTEMVFHQRGFAGAPGDGYVYDGWDEALNNLAAHLGNQPVR